MVPPCVYLKRWKWVNNKRTPAEWVDFVFFARTTIPLQLTMRLCIAEEGNGKSARARESASRPARAAHTTKCSESWEDLEVEEPDSTAAVHDTNRTRACNRPRGGSNARIEQGSTAQEGERCMAQNTKRNAGSPWQGNKAITCLLMLAVGNLPVTNQAGRRHS